MKVLQWESLCGEHDKRRDTVLLIEDVNISHFYGANVAHFQLVMFAYNLMNLFKELVLGQKDKKRMGKRIISNGRKFNLKLFEDWAYKEEYNGAERRVEALVWVT